AIAVLAVALVGAVLDAAAAVAFEHLVGIVTALAEVLRLDVANVQKAVAAHAKVDEGGLDTWLQVDDRALVNVADVGILAGAFNVQFFQLAILKDGNPALLRLGDVDQN